VCADEVVALTSEVRWEKDLLLTNEVPEELLDADQKPGKMVNRVTEREPKGICKSPPEIYRSVPFQIFLKMCQHHML